MLKYTTSQNIFSYILRNHTFSIHIKIYAKIEMDTFFAYSNKIFIIEVYLLKYYKWRHSRKTIFFQFNIMVYYVNIIDLCHSVAILWEIYVMRHKCHVRWLRDLVNRLCTRSPYSYVQSRDSDLKSIDKVP